jgi:hypothetical protein
MDHSPNPSLSIVICSIDARKFERVSQNYRQRFAGRDVEIVGIHDARSLAEGYNRGIARSRGERVILSHDDIEILTVIRVARRCAPRRIRSDRHCRTTRPRRRQTRPPASYVFTLITSPLLTAPLRR